MNDVMFSSENMCWGTPQDIFDDLNNEFHFTLDAAASDKNAKCKKYYTEKENSLKQSWDAGGAVFCNPPYGRDIKNFVRKAYEESKKIKYPIVMLIPARTDTQYFHDYIYGKAEIRFIRESFISLMRMEMRQRIVHRSRQ